MVQAAVGIANQQFVLRIIFKAVKYLRSALQAADSRGLMCFRCAVHQRVTYISLFHPSTAESLDISWCWNLLFFVRVVFLLNSN